MAGNHRNSENACALWINANLATMAGPSRYGAVIGGALAVSGGRIVWAGPETDIPEDTRRLAGQIHDAEGRWITPGLIDCHTHIIWGGSRANEFEMRLLGATYEEIAQKGGGIRSTVAATRQADDNTLFASASWRLDSLMREGLTTVEIKSGYGLDLDTELRMLRIARRLGRERPVTVKTTYLGAHALPPEYEGRSGGYVDFICREVLPAVAAEKLADAVDAFCETIGFTPEQTARVFEAARDLNLPVKLHAEQLSDLKGAALAAGYGALSADHLEHLSEESVKAMAKSGTVAVLLPGAFYCLRDTHVPPISMLRRHNVPMAISTDCNPGTSPVGSILLMLNMACTLFRLTPEEALRGVTVHAARALGLERTKGTLEAGKDADFVLWDVREPAELAYGIGFNPCHEVIRLGKPVLKRN